MKNKKILALTTVLALSTTTLAFANEIKMVEKNGHDYVPFKTLVKKLGGEVEESKDELKANINSTKITIQTKSSFAKVDENYYPLEEKEMNGYKVPIDAKPMYDNKELYVSPEFLKSANLLNFDIEDGKLIINNKVEKEISSIVKEEPKKEEPKKEVTQSSSEVKKEEPKKETQEKPQTTTKPSKPNKPSNNHNNSNNNSNSNTTNKPNNNNNSNNNSNNNNSSNNSNNNSNNNNNTGSNNGSSEDSNNNTESNNGSNTNGGNAGTDNSQNSDSQTSTVE